MAIINDELYEEVQRRVAPYLIGNVMDRAKGILEFCSLRSEEEVKGLLGYINWAHDQHPNYLPESLKDTIQHDIDGRTDAGMIPRTSNYAKFYKPDAERTDSDTVECDSCQWQGPYDDAVPAKKLSERIDIGGTYTDVECPECGALCYPVSMKF